MSILTSSWDTRSAGSDEGLGGVEPSKAVCSNEPPSAEEREEQERDATTVRPEMGDIRSDDGSRSRAPWALVAGMGGNG